MDSHTEAFRRYLAHERYAPGTITRYVEAAAGFLAWLAANAADQDVRTATRSQVRAFLEAEDCRSPSVVRWNIWRSALGTFFDWLHEEDDDMSNPAKRVHRLDVVEHQREPLELDQVLRLVEAIERKGPKKLRLRDVAIIQLFFHSALRVAEVVKVDLAQVDLQGHYIRDVVTKGDSRLTVIINDVAAEALERYLAVRSELGPANDEQALFLSQRGTRLSVRTVEEMVKRYAKLAGLPEHVTPHVLRHSSATELKDITDIRVVQEHLGHKLITTTQRYTHTKMSERRAAVDELGRRWRRTADGRFHSTTAA